MLISADLVAQRRYARDARKNFSHAGLAIGLTMIRGLRDIGFTDTAAALAALIDNAIDAGARVVDIVIETERDVPSAIAVIDNGYGMVPEMMRAACAVGVTCRLGDGPHLARNGFGLPSAPFAIGTRFDLFSCPRGEPLHAVTVDLAELASDKVPAARRATLPSFVGAHLAKYCSGWSAGTAVIIGGLDRATPHIATRLRADLARHLGFVFGRLLHLFQLRIDGVAVQPVDPLFLTPGARHGDRWASVESKQMIVDIDGVPVVVMLSRIGRILCATRRADGLDAFNDYAGLVVARQQRRLTTLATTPIVSFDRKLTCVRAEIDFPASLDDVVAPVLSLQQVHIADTVWRALRAAGLSQMIQSLRRKARMERTTRLARDAPVEAIVTASPRRRNRCPK